MKQTSSFQRWKRRYFKIKPRKLYYAKDSKSVIFEEVDLTDLSIAECSIKNVNHSFQVITPFRRLILCAESRKEMEEWITALKNVSNKDFYEGIDHHEFLSGQHNWYVTSHARPTYCNVCREALSGVTSHGVSCEVCKFKAHKRCAVKAPNSCKWTTLSSVGKDIIEDEDINIAMPHQWLEGNLPVSAKCSICDKTCGSVLRLQDWRCLWCRAMVHSSCKAQYPEKCPLGVCRASIVPPTALHSIGNDESWKATCPLGCSPLLVFVNSKSGDNQGVKFLRRFKQLLNPAQVFDLMNGGPGLGLRMFRTFNPFRILVCGGDGSVSWVLTEIDKLNMHNQCQVGVLPLGTGNDLARVLGWGSSCDDDAQLPQLLEKYEKATVKSLDRWCIMTYEGTLVSRRKSQIEFEPISQYEDSVVTHLTKILHSDQHSVVISSAKVLCETVKNFIAKVGVAYSKGNVDEEDTMTHKCEVLNEKLEKLLLALKEESSASYELLEKKLEKEGITVETPDSVVSESELPSDRPKKTTFIQREALMSRANSLKKAVRQIIEHTERAVDEQNEQTGDRNPDGFGSAISDAATLSPDETHMKLSESQSVPELSPTVILDEERPSRPDSLWNPWGSSMGQSVGASLKDTLQVTLPTIEGGASADSSPCPSPHPNASPAISPCSSPISEKPTPESLSSFPPEASLSPELQSLSTDISHFLPHSETDDTIGAGSLSGTKKSETAQSPTATRRISSGATLKQIGTATFQLGSGVNMPLVPGQAHERTFSESSQADSREFPIINPLASLPMWPNLNKDSLIGKVLLANADALCAAASPLMDVEEMSLEGFDEKCVMNNYFGIGVDAKISLEFHNKREEHPEKCRSRTRNLMWYGVLGGKELLHKTFKNLEQRVHLECDGRRIPLPSLQGIVVMNIPSYGGGSNFWGGTKEDDVFYAPAFDDKILEVVAVFGTVQIAASRVINLQHHRIAQCRSVKIIILGDEGVPVQVDGEAWIQPPGYICIVHKNRTQVLCRNRQLETSMKMWHDKRNLSRSMQLGPLTEEETHLVGSFSEAAVALIKCVKFTAISHATVQQDLFPIATQVASYIEKLYHAGKLVDGTNTRQTLTDLVFTVRHLLQEVSTLMKEKCEEIIGTELEDKLNFACSQMEKELRNCTENQGWMYFHSDEEPGTQEQKRYKGLFKLKFRSKQAKGKPSDPSCQGSAGCNNSSTPCEGSGCGTPEATGSLCGDPLVSSVLTWGTSEVALWLESVQMGEYKDCFIRHDIQGPELLHLERRDLKELGVTKVGHIKRLLQAIKDITSHSIGRKLALL
ncbi:diacylglycerol kinase eta-like [Uloborus diversus]|uniref:diacylglycerol kinase eta-like n=1 Tax=Uloborus diversus TaxID=327109 RepID=UPI00240A76B8|nr:diacylglycerol kinase eta-like [Uloborus diversus]